MPLNGNEKIDPGALASQIASAIGSPWRPVPPDQSSDHHRVAGSDGEQIALVIDTVRRAEIGRVELRGLIPPGLSGRSPRITVAVDRDAQAIASDIGHRLLPGYRDILAKARDLQAQQDEVEATRTAMVDRLIAALGAHGEAGWRPGMVAIGPESETSIHGNAEVSPMSGTVSISVTAPAEAADVLMRAIAAINATAPFLPAFANTI